MPITLVTGLPGHGKTLYTIDRWKAEADKAGRPVFHNNIPGLSIPGWQSFDVRQWETLPAGALVIVDEAWEVFPVTGRGQTPGWVQNLAKHRHLGLDFVVIVQQPMLLDSFVRRLVDRHFHVVRAFGAKWATIYENPTGVIEDVQKPGSRKDMIRHEYRYNQAVFGLYKSAELHTVKLRLPGKIWLLGLAAIAFPICCYLAWLQLRPGATKDKFDSQLTAVASAGAPQQLAQPAQSGQAPSTQQTMTPAEYVAAYTPRLPGLAHTAPIYDGATQPTQAPYPAACIASKKRCQCYSQQSTRLDMDEALCRRLADGGFFVAWQPTGERVQAPNAGQAAQTTAAQGQGPGHASLSPQPPQFVAQALDEDFGSLPRRIRRAAQ